VICPNCKKDMIVVGYHRIELDYCPSCEGVWFDGGELDLLLQLAKLESPQKLMQEILGSPLVSLSPKKRRCPICGRTMQERAIGEPPIDIDICGYGDGIFFDGGEVQQLLTRLAERSQQAEGSRQEIIFFLGDALQAKNSGSDTQYKEDA
jgi:Zn-finger nucleic acid-binding protein